MSRTPNFGKLFTYRLYSQQKANNQKAYNEFRLHFLALNTDLNSQLTVLVYLFDLFCASIGQKKQFEK
jgi:hypothetical protein